MVGVAWGELMRVRGEVRLLGKDGKGGACVGIVFNLGDYKKEF